MSRTPDTLRVLYAALKWDYGIPARGLSFEHENFHDALAHMPDIEVRHFAFDEVLREHGRSAMNAALLSAVDEFSPDIAFFILFTDEFTPQTIRAVSARPGVTTIGWFCDDHWRFDSYSRRWAPVFHWTATTDAASIERYHALGVDQVVRTQWAFNHHRVVKPVGEYIHDASFVGTAHSTRRSIIRRLEGSGVEIHCRGRGWEHGRIRQDEMIALFQQSRINLNFTESMLAAGWRRLAKVLLTRRADDSWHLNKPAIMHDLARALAKPARPQIKGRNFEIPGHGGFMLTGTAEALEEYFVPGKEIAVFTNESDLEDQIRYYLDHEDERERIRRAGHERTLREHTYEQRLRTLFRQTGASI